MNPRKLAVRPVLAMVALTTAYLGLFVVTEAQTTSGHPISGVSHLVMLPCLLTICSLIVRYFRWTFFLRRAGYSTHSFIGFVAYFSGFAFTASPGKLGELVRCRYFSELGVPYSLVVATFFLERSLDLIVILLLASVGMWTHQLLAVSAGFVVFVLLGLGLGILLLPVGVRMMPNKLTVGYKAVAVFLHTCKAVATHLKCWLSFGDFFVGITMGSVAWLLIIGGGIFVLDGLGIVLPLTQAASTFPLAMLVGAMSLVPGGLGATEAAIVFLLSAQGVSAPNALLVAILFRLSTLWLAMAAGFICLGVLEKRIFANDLSDDS